MSDVKVWNKKNLMAKSQFRHFPTDMMLRAVFSDNYFNSKNKKTDGVVLDIGCLYANNLVPFSDRGWTLYGTEVTEDSLKIAKKQCGINNITAELKLGFNTQLPFESDKFDVLMSIATIHYEESLIDVEAALKEMSRVVKVGGCAVIATVAPQHGMFKNSKRIGEHLYQLNMESDLRHLQNFIFFENAEDFVSIGSNYFQQVEVARCTETYPNQCIDMWLFTLTKS